MQRFDLVTESRNFYGDEYEVSLMKEDSTGEYVRYKDVEELAAQVHRLQTFIKLTCKKWEGVPELEPTIWNLQRVANETPGISAMQVVADAGRAGFMGCVAHYEIDDAQSCIDEAADKYVESIRQEIK